MAATKSWRELASVTLAVSALAALCAAVVAVASAVFHDYRTVSPASARCAVPSLSGTVVSVRLFDMRSMMDRSPMMGGRGPMSQRDWRAFRPGMMRLLATPTAVPRGTVSFRVVNAGLLRHELVVLPLIGTRVAGARSPGADGTVSEQGSLGEASATCSAGPGGGIAAGSLGWVTLQLPAGRYELICNLPGHYAAGMYAELDAS